ncbi:MAG: hypothetical protein AVDCRST_MAG56-3414 [uncultured Cytophagales bacterium]|uniref:Uncharacterized protein n=1 Tax=uncultured Cytophagales bacterium TaxID=158755 RepID=A0A6J4JD17_9SPHI|nr:MAG: hypothetical protein AVDCRST_MAG56-3414 [uncultured Cytophagales bacterium]
MRGNPRSRPRGLYRFPAARFPQPNPFAETPYASGVFTQ